MAQKEIERKFLVDRSEWEKRKAGGKKKVIRQGYALVTGEAEVRIRTVDDVRRLLTIKSGRGLVRDEYEIELEEGQFEEFKPLLNEDSIHKVRSFIPFNSHLLEVDEYLEDLEGLVVAEVEFDNREAADRFEPPSWFGEEITADSFFKNKNLYGKSYGEVEEYLHKSGLM